MINRDNSIIDISDDAAHVLRLQAEEFVRESTELSAQNLENLSPEAMRQILHQLQVHQIELEMQNEELLRTQLQLDTALSRYFDLYDLAPVGYCTISELGIILEANIAAATLLGVCRRELVGQRITRFVVKAQQDIFYQYRKQHFILGEPLSCELQMMKSDGSCCWVSLLTTAIEDVNGETVQRIVLNDVTERKHLHQILQDKNSELERAKSVAEKANLAKTEFLSSMSHELRTPLNAILGFGQLIESGVPTPTPSQQRSIGQILKAGWYLLALINEILDLALIESGKLSLSLEAISLNEVMAECQSMIEPQAQKYGITVTFPTLNTPYFVKADHTRLKQVLINLLSNAIKYNKLSGSVVVVCRESSAGRIRLCIEDTGEGLNTSQIEQLFQPFNRLGQEKNKEEGTGIGLVVCKRLIELMGGTIGIESTVGVGSVFWFELDLVN
ncbi:MAG: ATP-binding protein [Agitococcus sp.]|nr:ATP-binding protein [Agitococcus sp.]